MADQKDFESLYKKYGSFWVRKAQKHFADRKEGMPEDLTPAMLTEWIEKQQKSRNALIQRKIQTVED